MVLCSGKHYYLLAKEREVEDTAIVRLEQLCPFPSGDIHKQLSKFHNARGMCIHTHIYTCIGWA